MVYYLTFVVAQEVGKEEELWDEFLEARQSVGGLHGVERPVGKVKLVVYNIRVDMIHEGIFYFTCRHGLR